MPKFDSAVAFLNDDKRAHAVDMDCCCTSGWVVSDWTAGSASVKQRPEVQREMWNCVSNICVMQQFTIAACCDDSRVGTPHADSGTLCAGLHLLPSGRRLLPTAQPLTGCGVLLCGAGCSRCAGLLRRWRRQVHTPEQHGNHESLWSSASP